jgi:hypothetical protein
MYLQVDTENDKLRDRERRGGPERRGEFKRPLKNRKIRELFKNWWGSKENFKLQDHSSRGISSMLTWTLVQSLQPNKELEDRVVDAYLELLVIREKTYLHDLPVKKIYIAGYDFMVRALTHAPVNEVLFVNFAY